MFLSPFFWVKVVLIQTNIFYMPVFLQFWILAEILSLFHFFVYIGAIFNILYLVHYQLFRCKWRFYPIVQINTNLYIYITYKTELYYWLSYIQKVMKDVMTILYKLNKSWRNRLFILIQYTVLLESRFYFLFLFEFELTIPVRKWNNLFTLVIPIWSYDFLWYIT